MESVDRGGEIDGGGGGGVLRIIHLQSSALICIFILLALIGQARTQTSISSQASLDHHHIMIPLLMAESCN